MPTQADFAAQALTWAKPKTPFRHQARVKGANGGVDCIGLVIGAGSELGNPEAMDAMKKVRAYSNVPDGKMLRETCQKYMDEIPYNRLQRMEDQCDIGNVLLFWVEHPQYPRHVMIYTGVQNGVPYIVHSFVQRRGVVHEPFDHAFWAQRIVARYKIRSLD